MYRVIVIDDEIYAADSLRDYIVTRYEDRYDVYSVYTAAAALELMKRSHFDIVVTDIMMPGMDGLELLSKIRHSWPVCRIILMSGYDSFDYIYEAMKKGGSAYILKSDIYALIGGELEKVTQAIENELSAALEYSDTMCEQCDTLTCIHRDDSSFRQCANGDRWSELVNRLARGNGEAEKDADELESLNFPIKNGVFSLALIQMHAKGRFVTDFGELIRLGNGLMSLTKHIINGSCAVYVTVIKPHLILMLIQSKPEAELMNHHLSASVERLQTAVKLHMGVDADMLVTNDVPSLLNLRFAVDRMKNVLYNLDFGIGRFMTITDAPDERRNASGMSRYDYTHYLMMASSLPEVFDRLDAQEIYGFMSGFAECFDSCAGMRYTSLVEVYMSVSNALFSFVLRHRLYERASMEASFYKLFMLEEFKTWLEAYGFLLNMTRKLLSIYGIAREKPALLDQIIAFIDENIENDLSLITIGEAVGLNSSYLSRLFRKETGKMLSSYISNRRISHACSLLANSELKMSDIAARIGFTSVNYFYSFFKKEMGMPPQKYRESISL